MLPVLRLQLIALRVMLALKVVVLNTSAHGVPIKMEVMHTSASSVMQEVTAQVKLTLVQQLAMLDIIASKTLMF